MICSFSQAGIRRASPLLGLLCLAVGLAACQPDQPPSSHVARVGAHYLTQDQLNRMLEGMNPISDSAEARQQIIDQWVTNTLLYREALSQDLESAEEVKRKLQRQRRSILITAMTNRIREKADPSLSQEDVRTYFERHKDQMRLREPYLSVQYLITTSRKAAQTIRQRLRDDPARPDSLWRSFVRDHAVDSSQAFQTSRGVQPERHFARRLPYSQEALSALDEGDVASIVKKEGQYHVLQIDRRLPEGSEPKLSWFEDEIRRRLQIRARKQMYTREVQRLRSEARADGELELP